MNDEDFQLSSEASALLSELRGADDPTGADRARVKKALMATVAGGAGLAASTAASSAAAATATGATAATGVSFGVKVAAAIFAIGAIGTTAVVVPELIAPEPSVVAQGHAESAETAPEARASAAAESPARTESVGSSDVAPIAPPDEPAELAELDPEVTVLPTEPRATAPADDVSPRRGAPGSARHEPAQPAPDAPSPPDVAPPAEPPSTLSAEVALLHRAQRAIHAGRADDAIATLAQHAARFPDGVLVEEREAARVVALCDAGRADEARSLAARFLRQRPASPLAPRVRAACP